MRKEPKTQRLSNRPDLASWKPGLDHLASESLSPTAELDTYDSFSRSFLSSDCTKTKFRISCHRKETIGTGVPPFNGEYFSPAGAESSGRWPDLHTFRRSFTDL